MEITTVADDEVVLFDGRSMQRLDGLVPGEVYEFGGTRLRTHDMPGELLARVATVNDVHIGETICGLISGSDVGPTFGTGPGEAGYPDRMSLAAIAEIDEIDARGRERQGVGVDAVLVKGDLTGNGRLTEYERFLELYGPAFGDRLLHVRGNHDSYHGHVFADTPCQERVVPGATLALLDTARAHRVNGSLSAEQLDWLDELASRTDTPVLVFGHHHVWSPDHDARDDDFFGIVPADSEALFDVFARRPNLVGYFAGHTHRNRRIHVAAAGGAPFVEIASVKDFPGSVAEYRIHEGGVLQVFRRISSPEALAWTERTRQMYEGGYGAYAFGHVADRCFAMMTSGARRSGARPEEAA